eukprot:TRINITY_DN1908_c0_g1_i1.p2 TRINITY_DN1908_c0_g1~~TRINITY_DN1908_c0_g1_i1.p2  ORF type:complete len:166 (+),score=35.96 TRINITY_DN1908_c0_g1_i1:280-777(+)
MPPKVDPSEIRFLRIKVFGGEPGPAATLAPKLGPLGLNAKKVGDDIIKAGNSGYQGVRCMIELKCQNRNAEVYVKPTSSALIIKALGNNARDRKKVKNIKHNGDLTLEQIKQIAKVMDSEGKSLSKEFTGTVLQVLGTAQSVGCTVNKQSPKEIVKKIKSGEIKV